MATKNTNTRIADALEEINEKLGGDEANHLEANHLEAVAENVAALVDSFDTLVRAVERMSWDMGRR